MKLEASIKKKGFMVYVVDIYEVDEDGKRIGFHHVLHAGQYWAFKFRAKMAAKSYIKRGGYKYPKEVGVVKLED